MVIAFDVLEQNVDKLPSDKDDKIIATLTYTPQDKDKPEQKLSHYIARLPDSVLESSLDIDDSSFANQKIGCLAGQRTILHG